MHLVFATSLIPDDRLTSGYDIAGAVIVDAFKRAGVRITLLGFIWPNRCVPDAENCALIGEIELRTESVSTLQQLQWLGKALWFGTTYSSVKMRGVSIEHIKRALEKVEPFDGFIINATQFAGAFETLLKSKPSIFIAHNVEFRSAEENAISSRHLIQKLLYKREARLLRNLERRLCDRAAYILTLSEDDRFALGIASDDRSSALPLMASREPRFHSPSPAANCDLALVGNWTWQPNRTGLDWFLQEVVPLLPHSMKIRIAGFIPADIASDHPGVELVGEVPNAVDFLKGAAVIPLISRAGTGIQLKTIEVFENGLPSVATSHSLRGIAYRPSNCLVTDDAQQFARLLQSCVERPLERLDGSAFYHAQKKSLDQGVRRALTAFSATKKYKNYLVSKQTC